MNGLDAGLYRREAERLAVTMRDSSSCHPGRSATARRAGTQGRRKYWYLLWVPDISLARNSGMTDGDGT